MIVLNTNFGAISIELDFDRAPISAKNFLNYAKQGFYDGTIFHRVIDGFMIQGGGFESGMIQKKAGDSIQNEADNGLSNTVGTLAMARTPEPHSASCQFFINVNDNLFLDHKDKSSQGWGYAVFARVADGMEVVNKIKACSTGSQGGHQDVPLEDIVIESTEVHEAESD